ncbi:MAG: hypothetical protein HQL01_08535 [Nitrospirae bacterium]|uniref:Uncharacterized protein n=1 Tax=uncultured Nitrospirae bacterium MY3-5B TaxID=798578 RepID=D9MP24_9BACT|nr:hypothetical protein LW3_0100 [uncultured Nitrospirae bacterium MY3-5B]MBF0319831.1 hypothetical protein [Nitrospirota bacterium]
MASAFNDLIDSTMDFVKSQFGQFGQIGQPGVNYFWDYLNLLQNKGFTMSNDFMEYTTRVLNAMINYQKAAASTSGMETQLAEITQLMLDFIKDTKGKGDWNDFLVQLGEKQLQFADEYTQYVKRVIEAVHTIYSYQIW